MASKPRKFCAAYPCNKLAEPGSSYCQAHKPKSLTKVADAFYLSPAWRRFREWFIRNHPLCAECEREGRTVQATIVDHVKELTDGGLPFDEGNAQSLCGACHNRKTGEEKQKRGAIVYSYGEKSSATLGK